MENFIRYSPLIVFGSIVLLAVGLNMNQNKENVTRTEESHLTSMQKQDSLQNVIDSLQTELIILENGFDARENRYEDVIGEYEIGLTYLKDYHPQAYKDFNRIIGMRERYTRELERENKERLSKYNLD